MSTLSSYGIGNIGNGLYSLQVGALRIPCLMASLNSCVLLGEVALRVVSGTLNFFGFTTEVPFIKTLSGFAPEGTAKVLRPYKDLTAKELAISTVSCMVIGMIGSEIVGRTFGPAPSIYNKVLSYVNVQLAPGTNPILAGIYRLSPYTRGLV